MNISGKHLALIGAGGVVAYLIYRNMQSKSPELVSQQMVLEEEPVMQAAAEAEAVAAAAQLPSSDKAQVKNVFSAGLRPDAMAAALKMAPSAPSVKPVAPKPSKPDYASENKFLMSFENLEMIAGKTKDKDSIARLKDCMQSAANRRVPGIGRSMGKPIGPAALNLELHNCISKELNGELKKELAVLAAKKAANAPKPTTTVIASGWGKKSKQPLTFSLKSDSKQPSPFKKTNSSKSSSNNVVTNMVSTFGAAGNSAVKGLKSLFR